MAQFSFAARKFDPKDITQILKAIKHAAENHDFDSGWKATPAGGVFEHRLGIAPKFVIAYSSNDPRGDAYGQDTVVSVNKDTITITGTAAFARVLANK